MSVTNRVFESLIQTKFGFVDAQKATDHRWYVLKLEGLPPILTKASHAKAEITGKLESAIAKQLRVRTPFFREMMSCTKSRDEYYEQIRLDPFPGWDTRF
jgi:hypothetical protein